MYHNSIGKLARKPQITKAFGLFEDNGDLVAVCTFGKPASPFLCRGICGNEYASQVYELNRLCRVENYRGQLSQFVASCLRSLKKENWIIVSYSDMSMNHHGYIYQACNFLYTGCTKQRTDKYTEDGKHCRHYDNDNQNGLRKVRSAKHRYVYLCTNSKKLKKDWLSALNYTIMPYPKGDNNADYVLGDYLKDVVVEDRRKVTQTNEE